MQAISPDRASPAKGGRHIEEFDATNPCSAKEKHNLLPTSVSYVGGNLTELRQEIFSAKRVCRILLVTLRLLVRNKDTELADHFIPNPSHMMDVDGVRFDLLVDLEPYLLTHLQNLSCVDAALSL